MSVNLCYINPGTDSKTVLLYNRSNNPKAQHKIGLMKLSNKTNSHYVFTKTLDTSMSGQANNRKHITVEPALTVFSQRNF